MVIATRPVTLRLFLREELTDIEYFMAPHGRSSRALRATEGKASAAAAFLSRIPWKLASSAPRHHCSKSANAFMIVRVFWPDPLPSSSLSDGPLLLGWYHRHSEHLQGGRALIDIVVAGRASHPPEGERPLRMARHLEHAAT